MNVRRKVCVVVTARPSYSRVRSLMTAIARHPALELQLVVAGSAILDRFGRIDQLIESEGFHIDRRVHMVVEGGSPLASAKSTGMGLMELATAFDDLGPNCVITIADRFETMATAVAASYMNIPLIHLQGGEVTGSIDEKVRHSITKLADVHLVATKVARDRVVRMGERDDRVFVTGCPSLDIAREVCRDPVPNFAALLRCGVGAEIDPAHGFIVVLQHPVTTENERARHQIEETLEAVAESGLPTLWFWPNVDAGSDGTSKGIRAFRERNAIPNVHFLRNVSPEDFLRLVIASRCIVGNSSVAIRECAFLGVPAVDIGSRQFGRERTSNVASVPHRRAAILDAIRRQSSVGRPERSTLYGDGFSGSRMAELIASVDLSIEKRLTYEART
jgi:UDP-hydrolysing UDP-N-acetyl-D-glucosamine 2-epimerase